MSVIFYDLLMISSTSLMYLSSHLNSQEILYRFFSIRTVVLLLLDIDERASIFIVAKMLLKVIDKGCRGSNRLLFFLVLRKEIFF